MILKHNCSEFLVEHQEPLWTQEEAIAFECAREAINQVIAIYSSEIHIESKKDKPDTSLLKKLRSERMILAKELKTLRLSDQKNIDQTCKKYSAIVRAKRKGMPWR